MSLIFVCDESGAKGHADRPEKFPGEVGVMAGYILPAEQLSATESDLEAICRPFRRQGKKLHVTDLGRDAEKLRSAIYAYLLERRIPIVYEAIHSQGFYDAHRMDPEAHRESLHTQLALGAFAKVVAYGEETGKTHSIRVITDRVDPELLEGFFEAIDAFMGDDPVVEVRKRKHPKPEHRTKAWIVSQVTWPEDLAAASFRIAGYSIESDPAERGLTVAADVLAGDLAYYFHMRRGRHFAGPLACEGALAGHRLEPLVQGLSHPDGYQNLCDTIYRHPIEATRGEVETLLEAQNDLSVRLHLAEIVRGRAYMIHVSHCGEKPSAESDWWQAREELGVPPDLWL